MTDIKHKPEHTKNPSCVEECPAGTDLCIECGACDECEHDAVLNENELPPKWQKFIERSKQKD